MASTLGPRRFGVSTDIETERRFRRIEEELAKLTGISQTQISGRTGQFSRSRLAPPQVTGLSLDNKVIGAISIKWNAVNNPDLRRYRVQFSTDESFATAVSEFKVIGETTFTFPEGDVATTYFARVRAETTEPGPYSATLNTTTGAAVTENLQIGAASNVVRTKQTSGFSPAEVKNFAGGAASADYVSTSFTSKGGPIIIQGTAVFDYTLDSSDTVFSEIVIDSSVVESFDTNFATAVTTGRQAVPGVSIPSPPAAGTHTVEIRIRLSPATGGGSTITPVQITVAVVELRR